MRIRSKALSRRPLIITAVSAVLALPTLAFVGPAQALDSAGVGPKDPGQHGFPAYYTDDAGVALQMCDDGTAACQGANDASLAPVDGENFYYVATTDLSAPGLDLSIEIAAEAAWGGPTNPVTFDRLRIRGHSDTAGDIVVSTPYGDTTVTAEDPAEQRNVNFTEDVGCAGNPCNFADMTTSPQRHITNWIISDNAPPGRIGDGVTAGPATMGGVPAVASAGGATSTDWVVMGKLANPRAVSVPTAVDFGNARRARTRSVRLVNLGTQAMTFGGSTLTGSKAFRQVSSTCTAGRTVNPGGGCIVRLRYRPNGRKQAAAILRIRDDARVHAVRLSATSAAAARVRNAMDFGAVRAGAKGRTRRLVVTNTGSLPLRVRGVRVAGRNGRSFRIRPGAPRVCRRGTVVPTGGRCAVYLRFEPKSFGSKRAALFLRTNGLPVRQIVRLTGVGR